MVELEQSVRGEVRGSMSVMRLVSAGLAAIALATTPVALSASDNAVPSKDGKVTKSATVAVPSATFATLKGVKAAPMSSSELDAVKGLHVHFITIKNGKLHLAGDVKTENNWSNEWGGTDGQPVAPSYKGLCVAHGNGSIFIPTGPPGTPVTLQCPAGS
jgi:hypothetical protein